MAVKRDIRKEIENRTLKSYLKNVRQIIKYLIKVDPVKFWIIFTMKIINAAEPIISLVILQRVINEAINGSFKLELVLLMGILRLLSEFLIYYKKKLETEYNYQIEFIANNDIHQKVTELNIADFENKEVHNNMQRASNSVHLLSYYSSKITDFFIITASITTYALILINYNILLLLLIAVVPIIMLVKKTKVMKEGFIKRWERVDLWRYQNYYNHVLTNDNYLKETKLLNADRIFLNKYKKAAADRKKMSIDISLSIMKVDKNIKLSNALTLTVFYSYLIYNLANGKLKVGNFNTYRQAYTYTTTMFEQLLQEYVDFEVDSIEIKEFFDFLSYDNKYIDGTEELREIETIEFKNVCFKYKDELPYVLEDVSFKLEKGTSVAFIGPNGSGKTTVMKLIEKVYLPTEGEILINGVDINEYSTYSIRNNISMLLQDFNLFQETVRENILIKEEKETNENLKDLVAYDDLNERIEELPEKFETVLGNWFGEGINFSKGQIQKLALSRIFAQKGNFVLLDEPNSALDPRSEKDMFTFIDKNKNIKTCILTLHVFTNIEMLDNIIMFEKGKIVANGSHKALYKKNKIYKEFYNLQERSEK